MKPPSFPRRIVSWLAPANLRDHLMDDLDEAFSDFEGRHGPTAARLWYWKQAFLGLVPLLGIRWRRASHPGAERGTRMTTIDVLAGDVKYAVRMLGRSRGFALTVILTMSVGIGVSTAMFGLVNAYLLRPLPYPDSERLVSFWDVQQNLSEAPASFEEFRDWKEVCEFCEALTAYFIVSRNYTPGAFPERLRVALISDEFFEMLGVEPRVGRTFRPDEMHAGGPRVVVVSEWFWRSRLGADQGVQGKALVLNGEAFTIIGVTSRVWLPGRAAVEPPAAFLPLEQHTPFTDRGTHFLAVIGRLREGVSIEFARGEMHRTATLLSASSNSGHSISVAPLRARILGDRRPMLFALLGAVVVVFLIAVTNVVTLLLVRASDRSREFLVRGALGDTPAGALVLVLREAMELMLIGVLVGLCAASATTQVLRGQLYEVSAEDPLTYGVAISLLALVMLVAAALPARRASRVDPIMALRAE